MSGKESSVAPKERINVTFKPSNGEGLDELELPLKLMMMGDYTLKTDDRKLEDRKAININKKDFYTTPTLSQLIWKPLEKELKGIKKIRKKGVEIVGGRAFIMKHMTMGNAILNASSAIFSKEALSKCKLDYTTFKAGGDRLFWIYLAEQGQVIHLKDAHNYFRQHSKKVTSNAAKSGLGFIESLKIYDYLKSHGYLYGWRKHLTHGYYMWLIGHVKDYQNTQVKKNIYDLWKPKCSYPTLNKYLFILHRVYTKLVDLF